jgi:phosphate/sulfate permease
MAVVSLLSLEQSPGIFTTWYFGLPTSSSQTLIGGLVGAALASASTVHWMAGVVGKVIVPVILSPFVGFVGGCVDDHRLVGVA